MGFQNTRKFQNYCLIGTHEHIGSGKQGELKGNNSLFQMAI